MSDNNAKVMLMGSTQPTASVLRPNVRQHGCVHRAASLSAQPNNQLIWAAGLREQGYISSLDWNDNTAKLDAWRQHGRNWNTITSDRQTSVQVYIKIWPDSTIALI